MARDLTRVLTELFNLRADEVSYVPTGANNIPFLITKGDDGVNLKTIIAKSVLPNEEKIESILKGLKVEDGKKEALDAALRVFHVLKMEGVESDELLDLAELVEETGEEESMEALKMRLSKQDEEIGALKKALAEKMDHQKMYHSKEEGEEDEMDSVMKSYITKDGQLNQKAIPAEMFPLVSQLWTNNKQMNDRLSTVTKSLEEEREERVAKEYNAKAEQFSNIKVEGLGTVLKDVATSCPDSYDKFVSVLKVANDGLKVGGDGDFEEIGSARPGISDNGRDPDAIYKSIEAQAVKVVKDEDGSSKASKVTHFISHHEDGRRMYANYLNRLKAQR